MKTNLLKVAFVAAIALVSGLNVFNAQKSDLLSDIALANVEALADEESDLADAIWNREDYTLDNGLPAATCWKGGNQNCIVK